MRLKLASWFKIVNGGRKFQNTTTGFQSNQEKYEETYEFGKL